MRRLTDVRHSIPGARKLLGKEWFSWRSRHSRHHGTKVASWSIECLLALVHPVRISKSIVHSYQISERFRAELLHDVVPVNLYGDLDNSNFSCNLLVHQSGSDQAHYLLLARAEPIVSVPQIVNLLIGFPPPAV